MARASWLIGVMINSASAGELKKRTKVIASFAMAAIGERALPGTKGRTDTDVDHAEIPTPCSIWPSLQSKPARGQATVLKRPHNVFTRRCPPKRARPACLGMPAATWPWWPSATARTRAAASAQAGRPSASACKRAAASAQARWGAASLGRRGRFAVGVAAGGLRVFVNLRSFFVASSSFFFSASRSAASTLPLTASAKRSTQRAGVGRGQHQQHLAATMQQTCFQKPTCAP